MPVKGAHPIADGGTRIPVGYDGHAYVHGLRPGRHTLPPAATPSCSFTVTAVPRWEIVPGAAVCR